MRPIERERASKRYLSRLSDASSLAKLFLDSAGSRSLIMVSDLSSFGLWLANPKGLCYFRLSSKITRFRP